MPLCTAPYHAPPERAMARPRMACHDFASPMKTMLIDTTTTCARGGGKGGRACAAAVAVGRGGARPTLFMLVTTSMLVAVTEPPRRACTQQWWMPHSGGRASGERGWRRTIALGVERRPADRHANDAREHEQQVVHGGQRGPRAIFPVLWPPIVARRRERYGNGDRDQGEGVVQQQHGSLGEVDRL